MPELPEVETIARALRPELVGQKYIYARFFWNKTLVTPSPDEFSAQIRDQVILSVSRRAKYLHITLPDYHLFIHLRMSGDLIIKDSSYLPQKHDRVIFTLSNERQLVFTDTRKFGKIWLTVNPDEVIAKLGPEPFDPAFTPELLHSMLNARHRHIKPLLLDQSFLAGLGNIYTDEALHLSGVHPLKYSDTISYNEAIKLYQSIQTVLQTGIEHNGASIDWVYRGGAFQNYFNVYGREEMPCYTCGTIIQKITVGQRGTHFCPNCQG